MHRLIQALLLAGSVLIGSAWAETSVAHAQRKASPDSVRTDSMQAPSASRAPTIRGPVWVTPSPTGTIIGLSIGPMLTQGNMWGGTAQRINGIGVDFIGLGLLLPLVPHHPIQHPLFGRSQPDRGEARSPIGGTTVNGLLVAPGGPFVRRVNGVSGSFIGAVAHDVRGVLASGIWTMVGGRFVGVTSGLFNDAWHGDGLMVGGYTRVVDLQGVQVGLLNRSVQTRGVQVGIYNASQNLRGIQLGLLNRTPERILPLVNWQF